MKKIIATAVIFFVAFMVLLISIFDSSAITYTISPGTPTILDSGSERINYTLPYMGRVLPDSPIWGLKALRDRVWFEITTSHLRKAELALLFADKRLAMAEELFKRGEGDVAISTYSKAEKYLPIAVEQEKIARAQGMDTSAFLTRLATAALKHKEISDNLIQLAPENGKPLIDQMESYSKNTYYAAKDALSSKALPVPKNPFGWE